MKPAEAAAYRKGLEDAAQMVDRAIESPTRELSAPDGKRIIASTMVDTLTLVAAAIRALPVPEGAAPEPSVEEVELAAREKMRKVITAMADAYVHEHEHFSYDPSTNAWETRSEADESYEQALRDAAEAIAKLNCEKFGHDWRRWNDITRQCKRCEAQEHGEHLREELRAERSQP